MATATKERVIGLWLDKTDGEPRWIVSDDTLSGGQPSTTCTVAMYDEQDYPVAKANALAMGRRNGRRVILTDLDGRRKCLHDPSVI